MYITNNSKQGVSFIAANKVYTSTNKTTIVWIETELSFSPRVDASHVYMHAWALGCFYSHISTRTFRRALTSSVESCTEIKIECPFSGVTKSGRVWRKVSESNARSVAPVLSACGPRTFETAPLTPSQTQPVKFLGWMVHRRACKQYVFRSCDIYFQCYEFWWRSFHMPVRKRRQGFQIWHFYGSFSNDIKAVKRLTVNQTCARDFNKFAGAG